MKIQISCPEASARLDESNSEGNDKFISCQFNDIYFSHKDGLAETSYVFLRGNNLEKRFCKADNFTIAETGFGTGLNFFSTALLWLEKNQNGTLTFISCEKYPLHTEQINSVLSKWAELTPLVSEFCDLAPSRHNGFHQLSLYNNRVKLQLLYGDASERLAELHSEVDAWFLDGFTPSRNPDMWHVGLFKQIARLSHSNTTLATFTAARDVRDGLTNSGFHVSKHKGYGYKRDMLTAVYKGNFRIKNKFDWLSYAQSTLNPPKSAIVIGGGIAGITTAATLAKRNIQVTLIEKSADLCGSASGVPVATVRPYFDASHSISSRFFLQAFMTMLTEINGCPFWHSCGISDRSYDVDSAEWINRFLRNCQFDKSLAIAVQHENLASLLYPSAGFIELSPWLKQQLSSHASINVKLSTDATALYQTTEGWEVHTENEMLKANCIVIATGHAEDLIPKTTNQLIRAIRGQMSGFKSQKNQEKVICGNGHHIQSQEKTWLGSSYIPDDTETDIRLSEFEKYANKVSLITGAEYKDHIGLEHFAAIRGTTADHLPLVGAAANYDILAEKYQHWHRWNNEKDPIKLDHAGLFLNLGHGSRGATSAWLCAQLLEAYIFNETLPVPSDIAKALHPARYPLRSLKRNGRIV